MRSQFSPLGGNGDKRTLRRRAAVGKVTRRPQAAKLPCANNTSKAARRGRRALHKKPLYHRPLIRHGFAVPPFPIPSVASRHLPLTRGVGPRGEGFFWGGAPSSAPLRRKHRIEKQENALIP